MFVEAKATALVGNELWVYLPFPALRAASYSAIN